MSDPIDDDDDGVVFKSTILSKFKSIADASRKKRRKRKENSVKQMAAFVQQRRDAETKKNVAAHGTPPRAPIDRGTGSSPRIGGATFPKKAARLSPRKPTVTPTKVANAIETLATSPATRAIRTRGRPAQVALSDEELQLVREFASCPQANERTFGLVDKMYALNRYVLGTPDPNSQAAKDYMDYMQESKAPSDHPNFHIAVTPTQRSAGSSSPYVSPTRPKVRSDSDLFYMDPSDGTMTVEDAFATVSELIPAQCTDAATASPDATTPRVDRHAQVMKKQLARSPKVEGKLQDSSSEPEDESSKTPFRRRADRVHASFHAADTNHTGVLNLQQLRDVLLGLQAAECSSSEEEDVDKFLASYDWNFDTVFSYAEYLPLAHDFLSKVRDSATSSSRSKSNATNAQSNVGTPLATRWKRQIGSFLFQPTDDGDGDTPRRNSPIRGRVQRLFQSRIPRRVSTNTGSRPYSFGDIVMQVRDQGTSNIPFLRSPRRRQIQAVISAVRTRLSVKHTRTQSATVRGYANRLRSTIKHAPPSTRSPISKKQGSTGPRARSAGMARGRATGRLGAASGVYAPRKGPPIRKTIAPNSRRLAEMAQPRVVTAKKPTKRVNTSPGTSNQSASRVDGGRKTAPSSAVLKKSNMTDAEKIRVARQARAEWWAKKKEAAAKREESEAKHRRR